MKRAVRIGVAQAAGQHGVLDLLTVTRSRRLAILELKASENPDLPVQAGDYWHRVRHHQAQGHFERYGYFAGLELQSLPPVVYLIAPALRFHPTTGALRKYLSPEMEVVRVGLAESWREVSAWSCASNMHLPQGLQKFLPSAGIAVKLSFTRAERVLSEFLGERTASGRCCSG